MNIVKISDRIKLGNELKMVLISGPNVIESREQTLAIADELSKLRSQLSIEIIFKCSFDKANRSSHLSYRGDGLINGLNILNEVKQKYNFPVITDVHESHQVSSVSEVADIIQIPAFLCRQTDLIQTACLTEKPLLIKKMQMMSPHEMGNVVKKCNYFGNDKIILCERGTMMGYNHLTVDMTSFPIMKSMECPVAFDVTHSVQLPGANIHSTGGRRWAIPSLSTAAVSLGIAALFLEVSLDNKESMCDKESAFPISELKALLERLYKLDNFTKNI